MGKLMLPTLAWQREWHSNARWGTATPYVLKAPTAENAFQYVAVIPGLFDEWFTGNMKNLASWVPIVCAAKNMLTVGTPYLRQQRARKLIIDAARDLYVMRGLNDRFGNVAYSRAADLAGVDYTVLVSGVLFPVQFRSREGATPNNFDTLKERRANQTRDAYDWLLDTAELDQMSQPYVPKAEHFDTFAARLEADAKAKR